MVNDVIMVSVVSSFYQMLEDFNQQIIILHNRSRPFLAAFQCHDKSMVFNRLDHSLQHPNVIMIR